MAIEQQMNMLARGGLDDDGMSRDPVSGNTIPAGSMANEVRDDVDAKLSDGEYVVPANVVRFFGVKFFEDLRTQAMQGLGTMEANGRIGGEPMPSDMPMQDQMANSSEELSEQDMAMLQNIMNEGGDVRGYAHGGYHDPVNDPQPIPQSIPSSVYPLTQYATPGGSVYNPNLNPNVQALEQTQTAAPTPAGSESTFVTFVNPATGTIQVLQYINGEPANIDAYNSLTEQGFFVQGGPELAAYKQQQNQDNRESDLQMGGDKPKSINNLLSSDLYGDMSLGLGTKLAGGVINKAFPTKSNQQVLDFITDNIDPDTGESRFPPSGRGIPLRDDAGNIVYNAGGTPKFQTDKNGFILRSEGKDGPRNVAKEEVARILAITKIRKASTNSKGVLKNRAYRDALKKAGLAEGVGLTTKFVNPADWHKSAAGIAAIKALGTTDTNGPVDATSSIYSISKKPLGKQLTNIKDYRTEDQKTATKKAQKAAVKAEDARRDNTRFGVKKIEGENIVYRSRTDDAGSEGANVEGSTGENVSDQDKEVKDIKDYGYREDAGYGLMNKGGIVKKPKKKKTKKY